MKTMDAKLTLKFNSTIINKAKSFAKKHNSSLSRLVEGYLKNLTQNDKKKLKTPLVQELSGIMINRQVHQESYRLDCLMRKYS